MTTVYLFTGVETYNWQYSDFDTVCQFCLAHKIGGLVVKIYEITQGEWYQQLGGPGPVVSRIKSYGLDVLPYGFYYGASGTELLSIHTYLGLFGKYCVNLEGSWDGNGNGALAPFVNSLNTHSGELWVSTWANPVDHNWLDNIKAMDPFVDVWMPEEYNSQLIQLRLAQFPPVRGKIYPTYSIAYTPVDAMMISDKPSLWEWQDAQKDPGETDKMVTHLLGQTPTTGGTIVLNPPIVLNSKGMVADYQPTSQYESGESNELCGPFSVALNKYAGYPGKGSWGTSEDIDSLADTLSGDAVGFQGVMPQDMYNYFHSVGMHYWTLDTSDVVHIKSALQHGYPVICTVDMASVFDLDLGRNPYDWGPGHTNHVLTWVGIASDGNLLCVDESNVGNNLDGTYGLRPWPCRYDVSKIVTGWASIVQPPNNGLPWLPPIPSGDPTAWPTSPVPTMPPVNKSMLQAFINEWQAIIPGLSTTTGIAQTAWLDYQKGVFHGPALSKEYASVDWAGAPIIVQLVAGGRYEWRQNRAYFYPYR